MLYEVIMGHRIQWRCRHARDVGFSRWFGADAAMDAFFVAFKIPNLMRRFFAEGAFSQAFVPMISEYRAAGDEAQTRESYNFV